MLFRDNRCGGSFNLGSPPPVYNAPSDYQGSRIKPSPKNRKPAPNRKNANPPRNKRGEAAPKKNELEALYKDEVKAMFTEWFRKNKAVAGHVMCKQDVIAHVLKKLDQKQDNVLENAMDELNAQGFIETKEDGVTLVLTPKGADDIQQ